MPSKMNSEKEAAVLQHILPAHEHGHEPHLQRFPSIRGVDVDRNLGSDQDCGSWANKERRYTEHVASYLLESHSWVAAP